MMTHDGSVKKVGSKSRAPRRGSSGGAQLRHASSDTLLATAAGVVKEATIQSTIFDTELEERIPKFDPTEITLGHVLGRGGFAKVQEIEKIKPFTPTRSLSRSMTQKTFGEKTFFGFRTIKRGSTVKESDSMSFGEDEKMTRDYVVQRAKHTQTRKNCCYVVKTVSKESSKLTFMKANVDIALEGKFLSALSHRNIIDLVAVSSSGPCTKNYFLVLERMEETLAGRLKIWMDRDRMTQGVFGCVGGPMRAEQLYIERIETSYDIASAMQYLHSHKIVYRDLKPDNIGFDSFNIVKMFDFGLAKELHDSDKDGEGNYRNMTSMTGAIRYMAPEVGSGDHYNEKCDVYSWSMLMWYMLALEPPFGMYTEDMIMDRSWNRGYRPVIFRRWTRNMKELIKSCWDAKPTSRMSFLQITLALKKELLDFDQSKLSGSVTTSIDNSM
ncbi:MAG: hypothetical protein SGILL_006794 [Bacillariaceae sp.]